MTSIKICGITRLADGLAAARAGADGVGFVFAPSPREVGVDQASVIARRLPPLVARVGVFVDRPAADIAAIAEQVGLDVIQLHGSETPRDVEAVRSATGRRVVKALRLRHPSQLDILDDFPVDAWLIDSYHPERAGGTGETFPWEWLADRLRERARSETGAGEEEGARADEGTRGSAPIWLAGGLNPRNVAAALEAIRPDGVDVSSGVEVGPGVKDPRLIDGFIREVRRFDLAGYEGA